MKIRIEALNKFAMRACWHCMRLLAHRQTTSKLRRLLTAHLTMNWRKWHSRIGVEFFELKVWTSGAEKAAPALRLLKESRFEKRNPSDV